MGWRTGETDQESIWCASVIQIFRLSVQQHWSSSWWHSECFRNITLEKSVQSETFKRSGSKILSWVCCSQVNMKQLTQEACRRLSRGSPGSFHMEQQLRSELLATSTGKLKASPSLLGPQAAAHPFLLWLFCRFTLMVMLSRKKVKLCHVLL